MAKCEHEARHQRRCQCIAAGVAVFLIVAVIIIAVVYSTVYKPRDTDVQVRSLQLTRPAGIAIGSGGALTSVNVSITYQVLVYNPNRATYRAYGGDASLYYYGAGVGYMPIPEFEVKPRSSVGISFTLNTGFTPFTASAFGSAYFSPTADTSAGYLPLTSVVTIHGHVTTLNAFSHFGSSNAICTINVSINSKDIQSYFCK